MGQPRPLPREDTPAAPCCQHLAAASPYSLRLLETLPSPAGSTICRVWTSLLSSVHRTTSLIKLIVKSGERRRRKERVEAVQGRKATHWMVQGRYHFPYSTTIPFSVLQADDPSDPHHSLLIMLMVQLCQWLHCACTNTIFIFSLFHYIPVLQSCTHHLLTDERKCSSSSAFWASSRKKNNKQRTNVPNCYISNPSTSYFGRKHTDTHTHTHMHIPSLRHAQQFFK